MCKTFDSVFVELEIACAARVFNSQPSSGEKVPLRSNGKGRREGGFLLKDRWGGFLVTTRELWDLCRCRGPPDICIS